MTGSTRRIAVFILVALGAFLLAFGLGRVAGEKQEPAGHEAHGDHAAPVAGYSLELERDEYAAGEQRVRFSVRGADGEAVTDFDTLHEKELHLIVVEKEDPRLYRHVHPERGGDGTWSVDLDLGPGAWRLYADTQPAGAEQQLLDADIAVAGSAPAPRPLPAPYDRDVVGETALEVSLVRNGSQFEFTVEDRGKTHREIELEPYLGAGGHLVGIREETLDYLHAHAEQAEGDTVAFHVEASTPGAYVLHLDFKVDGKVHTATFVQRLEVDGPGGGMGEHMDHEMDGGSGSEGDEHDH